MEDRLAILEQADGFRMSSGDRRDGSILRAWKNSTRAMRSGGRFAAERESADVRCKAAFLKRGAGWLQFRRCEITAGAGGVG